MSPEIKFFYKKKLNVNLSKKLQVTIVQHKLYIFFFKENIFTVFIYYKFVK